MSDETRVSPKLLEQALKSCDDSLIKFVLNKTSKELIPSYINPLPPNVLPIFLKTFNKFLQNSPDSLELLLPWLENLIQIHQNSISASGEGQRRLKELQQTLKQRTQQIGLFVEATSLTDFVSHEREGKGIGLPIFDDSAQFLTEE